MIERLARHESNDDREPGLNWPRIAGVTLAIAIHAAALLLLLAPISPPPQEDERDDRVDVTFIEPPPPPPPPPEPPKPTPIKELSPPRPSPVPPPPEAPPIIVDEARASDVQAPPPAPPAPPAPVASMEASVDISSKNMNPPKYPPEEQRRNIQGTVVLVISVDANGNATDVQVEQSSGNRNLDRAAVQAAKRWRFNPASSGGQKTAGRVRVPVEFKLG